MQIIHTADFRNNTILAERGVKCVIRGYAFVKDTKKWLKRKYQARYDFEDIELNELRKNCELVTDEDKTNSDILDNLFDLTYEPCLELSVPKTKDIDTGDIHGGGKFGTYKIRINSALNNKTKNGIQGKYKAIVLIGEKYTEDKLHVITRNKSYIAMFLYFGVGERMIPGETTGEDGCLEIGENAAFTINLQFSLSEATPEMIAGTSGFAIELDDEYAKILSNSTQKDQTTTQLSIAGAFLVPSGKEYKSRLELENGKTMNNENVVFMDKTLNLVPNTDKNNSIFNVTPKVNIFDEHIDKFVKPQMLLSYGGTVGDTFKTQSIGFEYDPRYFALNEKAPESNTRFNLFGGATKRENVAYDDVKYNAMSGYLRLLCDRGYHYDGEDDMFIAANDNIVGMNAGTMILSNSNSAGDAKQGENTFKTTDTHLLRTDETSAVGLSGGLFIDCKKNRIESMDDVTAVGTCQASAVISAGAFNPERDVPYITGENAAYRHGAPGQLGMFGMNVSSIEFNGHGNIFIGHKGLLSNFGHDAVVLGNYNACGKKEYDICENCSGTGRIACTACADESGKPTGKIKRHPKTVCTQCDGTGKYKSKVCPTCKGEKEIVDYSVTESSTCPTCSGYGQMPDPECNGNGFIEGYAHPTKTSACSACSASLDENCPVCSGTREVSYQPTIAYEDGSVLKVGDGYFYKNLMKNQNLFDMYRDYIDVAPENNCDLNVGQYLKRMNLFSVENHGLLMVHNNNYDDIPNSDVKHMITDDFFAVRAWAKYDSLSERFANLQNGCYSPDTIYFPKRTTHNEMWKLRIRELNDFMHDNYIKSNASMLKTDALDAAMDDFYKNNNAYMLKLGPIITYRWDTINGVKGVEKTTTGILGAKGLRGLKSLKGTNGYKGKTLKITGMRYKYYIEDILKAIQAEYGKKISNNGSFGKNPETYTFYCVNGDTTENLYFKGMRLRNMPNGNYQTLLSIATAKPTEVQRIMYMDNGYYGEYGVMNFNYSEDISKS